MADYPHDEQKYLDLSNPERAKAWLRAFKARMRVKKHVDKDADADAGTSAQYDVTDNFLSVAGCHVVEKITMLMAPKKPEDSKFNKIEEVLLQVY